MLKISFLLRRWFVATLCGVFTCATHGEVVISEFSASSSARLLRRDVFGVPYVGTGPRWYEAAYHDAAWSVPANAPFGFGTLPNASSPIATNLQPAMQYLTPTVYFRRSFDVLEADRTRTEAVQLLVEYNDGFVAYLNGKEVARRNAGPLRKFIYHDQPAYNREVFANTTPIPTTTQTEPISLGAASVLLQSGSNLLAIHLLNAEANDGTCYLKASLQIGGASPVVLVDQTGWKYFPGVVEPSGNVFDPALLGSGKQNVLWGKATYDDLSWRAGVGPFGFGAVGSVGTNVQAAMLNVTPSLYTRLVFQATSAQAADPLGLRLIMGYDDGFVAYLNGVEVARRRIGLPNTFTPHDAVADLDGGVAAETITLDAASKLLVAGSNVLAIQTHNFTRNHGDFLSKADLRTNAGVTLAANQSTWKYFVGTAEPTGEVRSDEVDSMSEGPDSNSDWIELHNTGGQAVALQDWTLTDDPTRRRRWSFPEVSIPAGGYLLLLADGRVAESGGGLLHTSFKLSGEGGYLALAEPNGELRSELSPGYPAMSPFHSYVRGGDGTYRFSDQPTPGAANAGAFFAGIVAAPTVSVPGGHYAGTVSVSLSSETPGATVRYEISANGVEPTASSPVATGALTFSSGTVLRAKAFAPNQIPSPTVTHTYLLNQSPARRSLAAVCLSGSEQEAFYRPFGVLAIVGGGYWVGGTGASATFNAIWHNFTGNTALATTATGSPYYPVPNVSPDPTAYNAPMQSGRPAERPISVEVLQPDAAADLRTGAFVRAAGSPYSRQRYALGSQNSTAPNASSPWPSSDREKPQFNLFFRKELGPSPLAYPLVPGSVVEKYENIRLRAGKNDISNPFIRDEFTRRLMLRMGQVTVRGDFVNVYLNGVFKGYFNICERPREPFFQEARGTNNGFDVFNINSIADGDTLAYNELVNFTRTNSMVLLANYQALATRLDVVNVADYILLNAHAATWDWPHNNYILDRERSATGIYRFSVWDAEGGYGGGSRDPAFRIFNDIASGNVTSETVPAKLFYTQLRNSPEWKLLAADRIQKHFFNGGALTDAVLQAEPDVLKNKLLPMIRDVFGAGATFSEFLPIWLNGRGNTTRYTLSGGTTGTIVNSPSRRIALFDGFFDDSAGGAFVPAFFRAQGLWPVTQAPVLGQFGGNVPAGFELTITNPNAAGTIYYTLNGADPRAAGGATVGTAYSGPIPVTQSARVKARVLNGNEWSPLSDADFNTGQLPQLLITEVMYHPENQGAVDGDLFEFVEIKNVGPTAIVLGGMRFGAGIDFTFPPNASLAPGAFGVIASHQPSFQQRYPGLPLLGTFAGTNLSNGGESLALHDVVGNVLFAVSYSGGGGWPATADGFGRSLVPVNPNANPNPNDPAQWRASTELHGSPGRNDPARFTAWKLAHFTAAEIVEGNVAGDFADPDQDGLANLWEFVHGLDPRVADGSDALASSVAQDAQAGPYLTVQFRRNAEAFGLQIHVETASDLSAWLTGQAVQIGAPVSHGDGSETVTFRDTLTSAEAPRRFMRLRVIAE